MMRAECYTPGGETLGLELLMDCTLRYGLGLPCDSFELTAAWEPELAALLPRLYRCRITEDGALRFTGVVDECVCEIGGAGARLRISGRSPAALLLDTQVRAAEYQRATLDDLLRDYVTPAGIERVERQPMAALAHYTVGAGSSRWQALSDFTEYSAGVTPRFLPDGTLVLRAGGTGRVWQLDRAAPLTGLRLQRRRSGVVSEVTVVNRVRGTVETVRNEEFLARGGSAGRVLNVTGENDYRAMRQTGAYRIAQSQRGAELLTLTLAGLTELLPGDRAAVDLAALDLRGTYEVTGVTLEQGPGGSLSHVELAL